MTCQQVTELATDYALGALSPWRWLRFQLHVTLVCPNCRRYLRQLRATTALLGKLPREGIPPELLARLHLDQS